MLAATVRVTGDLDLAQECVQDAYAQALTTWQTAGVPTNCGAWLTTVARRRALDQLRREQLFRRALPKLIDDRNEYDPGVQVDEIADDRLRLICTCCHPALAFEARLALTLRLVCGLSTADIARAFLVSETTMAARITRAKKKIAVAGIPYRVPAAAELPERIDAILAVIHLVFTTGHTAPNGASLVRLDLVHRATDLARMLRSLQPNSTEVAGLLALILLTDARRDSRVSHDGKVLLLAEQDRSRWDRASIDEGIALMRFAVHAHRPGRYALQAAIAAVHDAAADWQATDWAKIVSLYDRLIQTWPSPVVALNRAVAVGLAQGPQAGLDELDQLSGDPQLAGYPYLPSSRASFLRDLGRRDDARSAYEEALIFTSNEVEREFLRNQLAELG